MSGLSFEYFPARNEQSSDQLMKTVKVLAEFQPDFQSVTYGAGGSSRQGTLEAVRNFQHQTGVETASHLTFTGSSAAEIKDFADELWDSGIKRIVALRGDAREDGACEMPFSDTPAFIKALKECHEFEIAVACYPEVHPKAQDLSADLKVLKKKQDAGASIAITQFFFDNTLFYDFVEKARAYGVTIPIVPGILPIYNFTKVQEMALQCKTEIPERVVRAFEDGQCVGSNTLEIASELLKEQVHDLACAGYESIHIYTLNKVQLAKVAAEAFNFAKQQNSASKKVA